MPIDGLANLPSGQDVLLDANVFIYAFTEQSGQCRDLLRRCAQQDVTGITTVEVVNEVCHRLMLAEAVERQLITKGRADELRRRREDIRRLTQYWTQTARIFDLNVLVLNLEVGRVRRAQEARARHGLLTNDSAIVAAADEYAIDCLATRDDDFDQIPWLTVYKPRDLGGPVAS